MSKHFKRISARDIVAFLVITGIFVLIAMGKNSYLYPTLALIIGYYFSKRVYEESKK